MTIYITQIAFNSISESLGLEKYQLTNEFSEINYEPFSKEKCLSPTNVGLPSWNFGIPCAWKEKVSEGTKIGMRAIPKQKKEQMYSKRNSGQSKTWMHTKDGTHKRVEKDQVESYIEKGYMIGRILPKDSLGRFATMENR